MVERKRLGATDRPGLGGEHLVILGRDRPIAGLERDRGPRDRRIEAFLVGSAVGRDGVGDLPRIEAGDAPHQGGHQACGEIAARAAAGAIGRGDDVRLRVIRVGGRNPALAAVPETHVSRRPVQHEMRVPGPGAEEIGDLRPKRGFARLVDRERQAALEHRSAAEPEDLVRSALASAEHLERDGLRLLGANGVGARSEELGRGFVRGLLETGPDPPAGGREGPAEPGLDGLGRRRSAQPHEARAGEGERFVGEQGQRPPLDSRPEFPGDPGGRGGRHAASAARRGRRHLAIARRPEGQRQLGRGRQVRIAREAEQKRRSGGGILSEGEKSLERGVGGADVRIGEAVVRLDRVQLRFEAR